MNYAKKDKDRISLKACVTKTASMGKMIITDTEPENIQQLSVLGAGRECREVKQKSSLASTTDSSPMCNLANRAHRKRLVPGQPFQ